MTPTELEAAARRKYNSVSDTFFSQAEILEYLNQASSELAEESKCIERTYTTTSTASTREIAFPTNSIEIRRVEYDGAKLSKISFLEDDAITLSDASTTQTGTPQYYSVFDYTIYLRPIPSTTGDTIKVYSINLPADLVITSTLEVPAIFHRKLLKYVNAQMAYKDQNYTAYDVMMKEWERDKIRAKMLWRKYKRGDSPAYALDVDTLPVTFLGSN